MSVDPKGWNPSYLAFCRAIGAEDPNCLPPIEGRQTFQEWMADRQREYLTINPSAFYRGFYGARLVDLKAYHAWVASLHTNQKAETP
jgi:hypothetical protein